MTFTTESAKHCQLSPTNTSQWWRPRLWSIDTQSLEISW